MVYQGYALDSTMGHILWSDQRLVSHRANLDGVLGQSIEELSSGCRFPAVEAEHELVEVVVEVLGPHRTLMSSK